MAAISIPAYMERLQYYMRCSQACYVIAFIYIDRLLQKNPTFQVRLSNVHRLLLAAIVVAIKFHDDTYFDNDFYSKVGGVSLLELNLLELKLLSLVAFELHIDPEQYFLYLTQITTKAAQLQGTLPEPMAFGKKNEDPKDIPAAEGMGSVPTSASNESLTGE